MGLKERKPVFGFAKNKSADQPGRLISAFVIRFLESTISNLLQAKFHFSS